MSAAFSLLRCSVVCPAGKMRSIGTTARERSNQAVASSNQLGVRSRLRSPEP